jgi:hypothetical protein
MHKYEIHKYKYFLCTYNATHLINAVTLKDLKKLVACHSGGQI